MKLDGFGIFVKKERYADGIIRIGAHCESYAQLGSFAGPRVKPSPFI
ncbi:MAG: hypothetical protein GX424_02310 [Clostridiales bacterium]|nr:hypothetical protein [Clostridiales bacterium]